MTDPRTNDQTRTTKHPDQLLSWKQKLDTCMSCSLSDNCNRRIGIRRSHPNYLDHPTIDLLFVGEAPSSQDYILRQPFSGPAGHELSELLAESLNPSIRYALTNTVHCTPFVDSSRLNIRTPSLPEITACRVHLMSLIGILDPKHIIALGKSAQKSLKKFIPERAYNWAASDSPLAFTTLMHPEEILASKQADLERARFTLAIEAISGALCEQ